MINFYVERQPDELLTVLYFQLGRGFGVDRDIKDCDIDSIVENAYPNDIRKQIFEKPNVI